MTAPRPPYCATCDVGVPANAITPDQHHDPAAGGCGGPVIPLPDRVDLPPGAAAIGIYAKMGQRWVLQWPPSATVKRAQQAAALYNERSVLELRPLYEGNPADIDHLARFDLVMDLNRQLAERAMQLRTGLLEALEQLEAAGESVTELRKLVNRAHVAGLAVASKGDAS